MARTRNLKRTLLRAIREEQEAWKAVVANELPSLSSSSSSSLPAVKRPPPQPKALKLPPLEKEFPINFLSLRSQGGNRVSLVGPLHASRRGDDNYSLHMRKSNDTEFDDLHETYFDKDLLIEYDDEDEEENDGGRNKKKNPNDSRYNQKQSAATARNNKISQANGRYNNNNPGTVETSSQYDRMNNPRNSRNQLPFEQRTTAQQPLWKDHEQEEEDDDDDDDGNFFTNFPSRSNNVRSNSQPQQRQRQWPRQQQAQSQAWQPERPQQRFPSNNNSNYNYDDSDFDYRPQQPPKQPLPRQEKVQPYPPQQLVSPNNDGSYDSMLQQHLLSQRQKQQRQRSRRVKPEVESSRFASGDKLLVEVKSFGPWGAGVDVVAHGSHDPKHIIPTSEPPLAKGFILQSEIHYFRQARNNVDVLIGEVLPAYVEKLKPRNAEDDDDEKKVPLKGGGQEKKQDGTTEPEFVQLHVLLREFGGRAKAESLSAQVLEKLQRSKNGVLPVGDKSTPREIASLFPGASKLTFKKAVAALYKQGKVRPGNTSIRLMD
ncbi:hypothetical protein ACA910_017112 [Epithemia clementina (nom. ined.)]